MSFDFEGIRSSFSKINKWIITIHSSKQKQTFDEEEINDCGNLLGDDIYNTMKEVINMMIKEWI